VEGQERLRAAHALVIGAGGLGCPAALYLAASGIGKLTIADSDKVDLTNLQRQILYRTENVGAVKVEAAQAALKAIKDFSKLVAGADVVLDCSDNFATRHALNRACVAAKKALVAGAAIRFDAQLMVFDLRQKTSPCYSCIFPEDAEVEEVQCSTMGVLAPLTGAIGAMQAMEAIKLVAGVGESLSGKLQVYDALRAEWRTVKVAKDAACAVCSAQ
jgi:adenylyltransferase/sulfurtransferase